MSHRYGVAVWGLGRAGTEIVKALSDHPAAELRGAVTGSPDKAGRDLGVTIGSGELGVEAVSDPDDVLSRPDIDVILYAGLGSAEKTAEMAGTVVAAGKSLITVSGFIHPASELGEDAAYDLHERAVAGGGRILGTGVNPGFLLDALPVMLSSLSLPTARVTAQRVNDMRYWGSGALKTDGGVGWDPDEIEVSDHLTLVPSLALMAEIAGGLGSVEPVETHQVLVTAVDRSDGERSIEAGQTMGFRRRAEAEVGGISFRIEWTAIFCLDPELDGGLEMRAGVEVDGASRFSSSIIGEGLANSYPATGARAVAAIAPLLSLPPGLYRPDQVPASPITSPEVR